MTYRIEDQQRREQMAYANLDESFERKSEHATDLEAYVAAQAQANSSGQSIVTVRLDSRGQIAPRQEGVWTDPEPASRS